MRDQKGATIDTLIASMRNYARVSERGRGSNRESFDCGKSRATMTRVEVLSGRRSRQTMRHSGAALSGRQLRYRRQTRNHRRYRRPRSDYANNKMQRNGGAAGGGNGAARSLLIAPPRDRACTPFFFPFLLV